MLATSSPAVPGQPWYRHRWPWLLMAGPAAVVVAGSATILIAVTRPDALVVDDYYKQGKAINQDLRRDRHAAELSMTATLSYLPAQGQLRGHLAQAGIPMAQPVLVSLVHPTQPQKDLRLLAQTDDAGNFTLPLPLLDAARWQVQVEDPERNWRLQAPWHWPQETGIALQPQAAPVSPTSPTLPTAAQP